MLVPVEFRTNIIQRTRRTTTSQIKISHITLIILTMDTMGQLHNKCTAYECTTMDRQQMVQIRQIIYIPLRSLQHAIWNTIWHGVKVKASKEPTRIN